MIGRRSNGGESHDGHRPGWVLTPKGQWLAFYILASFFTLGSCFGCLAGAILVRSILR